MNRKNGIDLFRLIGAFFIMCLHTDYGLLNQEIVDNLRLISRWAVPFFFITSGYFLGQKIDGDFDFKLIQKNVGTLISILLVSSVFYFLVHMLNGDVSLTISSILTGTHFHLWFIGSLIVAYIFLWYIYFIRKEKALPYISIGILLLALIADSYDQLIHKNIEFELFRFLLSIPFMYVGIYLSKKKISQFNNRLLILLVIMGVVLQYVESELFLKFFQYNKYDHQLLIGSIVIAIPLFMLSCKLTLQENRFSKWGSKYALFMYLYHPLIYAIVWVVISKVTPNLYAYIKMFSPVIGFILTLAFAIVLNKFFMRVYNIMNGKL